jgi:hypothetical protein
MNIERQVANAILQKDIEIVLGSRKIKVPRPTLGTMIEVSKMISEFGITDVKTDLQNALTETIRIAKDCDKLADILALLILGTKKAVSRIKIFGISITIKNRQKRLKKEILENLSPKPIAEAIAAIFGEMECGFFLSIITILKQGNILKPTTN